MRKRPLREADLLLTFFTESDGRLTGVAAHARRSQRRFGSALEPGTVGTVNYVERPHQELVRVEGVRIEWSPMSIAADMKKFAALGVLLEIVEATTVERQAAPEGFRLISDAVRKFGADVGGDILCWLANWFRLLGLQPSLDRCVKCGSPCAEDSTVDFVSHDGGIVCNGCRRRDLPAISLDPVSRRAWGSLAEGILPARNTSVQNAMWRYLNDIVRRPLKSGAYWEMLWR